MEQSNPYAAPTSQLDTFSHQCKRDGKYLILPNGSDLPARCIKCNAPVEHDTKRITLYWHTPWLYLLILLNILIYIVIGLIARRTHSVTPYLCDSHRRQRRTRMTLGLATCFSCVALIFVGAHFQWDAIFGLAILGALVSLLVTIFTTRRLYANKITKEYVRIGGCGEAFLASIKNS